MINFSTRTEIAARELQRIRDEFDRRRSAPNASGIERGRCAETLLLLQLGELEGNDQPLVDAIVNRYPCALNGLRKLNTYAGHDSGEYEAALLLLAENVEGRFLWAEFYSRLEIKELIERLV